MNILFFEVDEWVWLFGGRRSRTATPAEIEREVIKGHVLFSPVSFHAYLKLRRAEEGARAQEQDALKRLRAAKEEQEKLFPRVTWHREGLAGIKCSWSHVPTLPEICLELRAALNGSGDPWPDDHVRRVVAMLRARLASWMPHNCSDCPDAQIDEAVYDLVVATISSAIAYLEDPAHVPISSQKCSV